MAQGDTVPAQQLDQTDQHLDQDDGRVPGHLDHFHTNLLSMG